MLGFPLPYEEELVYSTIARARVHFCIQSPKELLDEVYNDRKVVATIDFPSHLQKIAQHYIARNISVEKLIYRHTLFPLYAPFIPEKRRQQCMEWLRSSSKGSVYLSLGAAASKLPQFDTLRYCPQCVQLQLDKLGECYWQRSWQVFGVECCLLHGQAISTQIPRHSFHRHEYLPATPKICALVHQKTPTLNTLLIAHQVIELLSRRAQVSPTLNQWTQYYKTLIRQCGFNNGENICYPAIKEQVLSTWGKIWLDTHGFRVHDEQSCWLRAICRKHRKSFCYLEHIVLLNSLLDNNWSINQVLEQVAHYPKERNVFVNREKKSENNASSAQRNLWFQSVRKIGPKQARQRQKALYAWLYRHDHDWLLAINNKYKRDRRIINKRVDWPKRDRVIAKAMLGIKNEICENLSAPRLTKNWYLSQISNPASVEKNMHKLPLCNQFFNKYSEGVSEYQTRRLTRTIIRLTRLSEPIVKWKVLRQSGLSEERLRPVTNSVFNYVMEKYG